MNIKKLNWFNGKGMVLGFKKRPEQLGEAELNQLLLQLRKRKNL